MPEDFDELTKEERALCVLIDHARGRSAALEGTLRAALDYLTTATNLVCRCELGAETCACKAKPMWAFIEKAHEVLEPAHQKGKGETLPSA